MIHIILTEEQVGALIDIKAMPEFSNLLTSRNVDAQAVELTDGSFALPESLMTDPLFSEIRDYILASEGFDNLPTRDVLPEEVVNNLNTPY